MRWHKRGRGERQEAREAEMRCRQAEGRGGECSRRQSEGSMWWGKRVVRGKVGRREGGWGGVWGRQGSSLPEK